MALDFDTKSKTITGFHKRDSGKFGIIESKYPILEDEETSIFTITRDHFFSITTPQIKAIISNFLRYKSFNDKKRLIANILIIPGLIIAFALALKYTTILDSFPQILSILESKLVDILFGVSILSVITLWHDFYEDKSHPIKLPKPGKISSKDIDDIKASGFKFGRYAHLETINFLNEESLELLCLFTNNGLFQTLNLYQKLISSSFEVQQIIRRSGILINLEELEKAKINKENIPDYPVTALRSILTYALEEALLTNSREIQPQHLFLAISRVFPIIEKFLRENQINIHILREITAYSNEVIYKRSRTKYLDPDIPYYRKGGIAREWIYGYTFILGHFSKDVNKIVSESKDIFGIGHDDEIELLVATLGKLTNRNALFIGDPGVGKSSLILGLAQRINSGDVPMQLKDKRIVQLDINNLIAVSKKEKNIEELIIKAFRELERSGNTILYLDEMQELIPRKAGETGHSLAGMILPYIIDSKFPIVGTTNYSDYKRYFYSNESLRQSFTNIEVREVSPKDTLTILESKIPSLEKNFQILITFPALFAAVELAQRYITERKLPSSAVQTIEATCAWAQSNNVDKITAEHVSKTVSIKTNISVGEIDQEESNKLIKLEENVKNRVIGQDEAVVALTESLRRARADVRDSKKPIGVFLFVGPTGVGKTHLAKVVGEEYFGKEEAIIRIDMSEYQDTQSIEKFLGSSSESGFGQSSISLVDRVKGNPYTVVLFDEIEKANPSILDLFLQIFDEGRLTSTQGETIDFTNTIIVCTSNIGSKMLLDALEKDHSLWQEAKERVFLEVRQALRIELVNRFDQIIVFHPHDLNNLAKIATLLLNELAARLSKKNIIIKWSDQIPMLIANKSNEPGLGARPMKRYIQEKIEGQLAKGMIEQEIKAGQEVEIKESWIV
jgi:ATP-dependent Clp protease ATP-binding subunit ClpC